MNWLLGGNGTRWVLAQPLSYTRSPPGQAPTTEARSEVLTDNKSASQLPPQNMPRALLETMGHPPLKMRDSQLTNLAYKTLGSEGAARRPAGANRPFIYSSPCRRQHWGPHRGLVCTLHASHPSLALTPGPHSCPQSWPSSPEAAWPSPHCRSDSNLLEAHVSLRYPNPTWANRACLSRPPVQRRGFMGSHGYQFGEDVRARNSWVCGVHW